MQNGAYSVGKVLGQGGFGITYLGADSSRKKPVAIKEFFPTGCVRCGKAAHASGILTPVDFQTLKQRFLEEADILRKFLHPNIVDVYGCFEENNTAYMVMEYLKGKPLSKLLEERGKLPETEAVGYVNKLSVALEEVHKTGLIHRDIKPENIIVTDDGRVVLLDFGSARAYAAGKTKRMTALVTAGYAPLEQYAEMATRGPFTDVYALAATLYHLLTGQMPPTATDRANGVAVTPPQQLSPDVSKEVSDAVMWAMAMEIGKRPQTVRSFLKALQQRPAPVSVPRPTQPLPPSPANQSPKPPPPQTHPWQLPVESHPVQVSAHLITWPGRCACCYEPSDAHLRVSYTRTTGVRVVRHDTRSWDVPYCGNCLQHIQLYNAGNGLFASGSLSLLIGSAGVGLFYKSWFAFILCGVLLLSAGYGIHAASEVSGKKHETTSRNGIQAWGGVVSAVIIWSTVFGMVDSWFTALACTLTVILLLVGFVQQSRARETARPTCCCMGPAVAFNGWYRAVKTFTFHSREYANAFRAANARKVVN
ncbi:MAG: serine/threonine protein kinase [Armatimonadetes bacterium]|nr:serine/threonine protein kinase [Armatimonadota bacterium]